MNHFKKWQQQRHDELAGFDSWLGLAGLCWLIPGVNRVGSAAGSSLLLPAGPAHLGDLLWQDDKVFWQPSDGEIRELRTDVDGQPSTVDYENWSFFIVDRDHRLAARLRDRNWATRRPFDGLDYFPHDPAWRIEAVWQKLAVPQNMVVPNVSGEFKSVDVAYQAIFEYQGGTVELLPMSVSDTEIFFVFRDHSSGKETYRAGRFLRVPLEGSGYFPPGAAAGKITLDFNYAFNPPCAFTPFATCPLPPPQNWLPFAVPAGEKKP